MLAVGHVVPGLPVLALGLVVDRQFLAVAKLGQAFGILVGLRAHGRLGPGGHRALLGLALLAGFRRRLRSLGRLALMDHVLTNVAVLAVALQEPPAVLELVKGHRRVFRDIGLDLFILGVGAGAHVHALLGHVAVLGVLLLGGGGAGVDDGGGRRGGRLGHGGVRSGRRFQLRLVAGVRVRAGACVRGGGEPVGALLLKERRGHETG